MKFTSKPKLFTRYFNSLIDHGDYFEKRSFKKDKLKQEFDFFLSLPDSLKKYYPHAHTYAEVSGFASYMVKKVDSFDCSYLMLDEQHYSEPKVVDLILKLGHYLDEVPKQEVSRDIYLEAIKREILNKNTERVSELVQLREANEMNKLCERFGYRDLRHYLEVLNDKIFAEISAEKCDELYFSHGDLCFSNLLIENDQLLLIDPKGAADKNHYFRPVHYELAKIAQSLFGNYDQINHELFDSQEDSLHFHNKLPKPFKAYEQFEKIAKHLKTSLKTVRLVEASLFLSLIPFHKESSKKMNAFLLNSLNIFQEIA